MECLKVLLCAGLASVGRTAPQFDAFDVVPASPLHERDPLLPSFDGLPPSFGNGFGFPADLYPSAADFGFGGVSPPGDGLPAADAGFEVPGLATPLPAALSGQLGHAAAFPFATPIASSQQTYTAASADGRLVPVAAAQTRVAGPASPYPAKTGPPAQSPRDYYDNDGINTTPSPPRPVFGAVPDPAVVLKPPPRPADTERPGHPDPVSPGVAFAGESSRQFAGPSQAADSDDDDSPNPLPGRPFDYSKPFPRPINVVALGPPTEQQKYGAAAVPQTYATSVSPTPGGFRVDDINNNNNPPNSVSGHYYRQQSDNDNNVVRPTLGRKPAQSVAGHHSGSAVFSDNSPNSVSGHYYRQQSDNNDNVYGQTVSPKPVQSVTVLQPYGGQVSGNNGAAPNSYQPSANGYGDAAVQNGFNELAAGFLSHGAAGKSGSFVAAGGDSNSISANNKRESIGGRGYGVEYKRD